MCFLASRPCHAMYHTLFTDGQTQITTPVFTQPYLSVYIIYLEPMGGKRIHIHTYTREHLLTLDRFFFVCFDTDLALTFWFFLTF